MLSCLRSLLFPSRRQHSGSLVSGVPLLEPAFTEESGAMAGRLRDAWIGMLLGVNSPLELPSNPFERHALKRLGRLLEDEHKVSTLVPRMPSVLPKLLSSFRDPMATSRDLAELIGRDLVSVAEVVRLANTPYYRRSKPVESLEQAVLVLGQRGLRQVVANLLMRPLFSARTGHFSKLAGQMLWEQAELTALLAAGLARSDGEDEFTAYLAGISSNLGLLVGCRVLDELFDGTHTPCSQQFHLEWYLLARQLSAVVVGNWELPAAVLDQLQALADEARQLGERTARRLLLAEQCSHYEMLRLQGRLNQTEAGGWLLQPHMLPLLRVLEEARQRFEPALRR